MRLTIIAPESVYEHEVDPSMEVRDIKALIEAEVSPLPVYPLLTEQTGTPVAAQTLSTDSGVALTSQEKTLDSYGLKGESATLFLTFRYSIIRKGANSSDHRPFPTHSSAESSASTTDDDFERMRLQALGDPRLMNQMRQASDLGRGALTLQANPDLAAAIQAGGSRFRELVRHREESLRAAGEEKQRQTEVRHM